MRLPLYIGVLAAAILIPGVTYATADTPSESEPHNPQLVLLDSPPPRERLSLGVNFIGGQIRYNLNARWAAELRYLTGAADSDAGRVRSSVIGFRGYRMFAPEHRWHGYVGAEIAHASAKSEHYNYSAVGFAAGAFGGFRYHLTRRLAFEADIGPYVISLREERTQLKSSNLDFVLDTALVWRVF